MSEAGPRTEGETPEKFDVCVVGLGYIGLPTAATLASRDTRVAGVDVNERVVARINEGRAHFSEPDLDLLLEAAATTGRLRAFTEPQPARNFIIAVPTPFNDDHSGDLTYVEAATRAVARVLEPDDLIVLESTSPVGTTAKMLGWIADERPDLPMPVEGAEGEVRLAYCPERILPGQMLRELVENDRVVGGVTDACAERAAALYERFCVGELYRTRAETAEMVKLAENAYRDVNIAFANELSILAHELGVDASEAISLANRHPRVSILKPGVGVGGHCIAVDPWFLIAASPGTTPLMRAARDVNDAKPCFVMERVLESHGGKDGPIALLGLAYKPNVNDLRESPAIRLCELLLDRGHEVLAVEPHVEILPPRLAKREGVRLTDRETAGREAKTIVLVVDHDAFADDRGADGVLDFASG